jgi:poly(A) polymerase
MKESTLKRFFRLREFDEHLALHRLDALSSSGNLELYEFARRRYQETPPEVARPVLYVTGKELIAEGYRPGREFQAMLAASEDAQLEGRIHSTEDGLALVREMFGAPLANSGS